MQNQEKIIQAIAAYLKKETIVTGEPGDNVIEFGGELNQGHFTHTGFCREIATEIAFAIAPHLEANERPKDFPYSELFDHMANEHGLTLTNTGLGDIIHIARK